MRPTRAPEGPYRSGFALLLGKPNVGKSTLLNRLVGEHVAAVSPRPQTTRHRILGVVTRPGTQLCLLDTPGVHRAKGLLNRTMVEAALDAMEEVDVILYLAEAGWPGGDAVEPEKVDPVGPFHRELLEQVKRAGKPVVLVLTKIDLVPKPRLLPLLQAWSQAGEFSALYPLSALTGENVDGLVEAVREMLPEGGPLFPPDTITDQAERQICAELIREQVFLQTHEEVPYGTAVVVDSFEEEGRGDDSDEEDALAEILAHAPIAEPLDSGADPDSDDAEEAHETDTLDVDVSEEDEEDDDGEEEGEALEEAGDEETGEAGGAEVDSETPPRLSPGLVRMHATIVVERPSHKAIVIGRGGQRLKAIGTASRQRIERLLGCRVWLGLHVRVIEGWTEKRRFLDEFGILPRT